MEIAFLTTLSLETKIQKMFEGQALVTLPSFFTVFAKSQTKAGVEMGFPEEGNVSSWPEAVK